MGEYLKVLLVGDGPEKRSLEALSTRLGLGDMVIFCGRVPHEDVSRYYSLIDIAPFPRKARRVCELVSPLKPFEAMAMKKSVIVSSVGALKEIVVDGHNGLIHEKGDPSDLGRCIKELVLDHKIRENMGANARKWVIENRTWDKAGEIIDSVYSKLKH